MTNNKSNYCLPYNWPYHKWPAISPETKLHWVKVRLILKVKRIEKEIKETQKIVLDKYI